MELMSCFRKIEKEEISKAYSISDGVNIMKKRKAEKGVGHEGVGRELNFFCRERRESLLRVIHEQRCAKAEGVSHVAIGGKVRTEATPSTKAYEACLACQRAGRMARMGKVINESTVNHVRKVMGVCSLVGHGIHSGFCSVLKKPLEGFN